MSTPTEAVNPADCTGQTRVAVLIVSYRGCEDLLACLQSIYLSQDEDVDKQVYVVENGSGDNTAETIRQAYPQVRLIISETNLGFTGGNNLGWEQIQTLDPQVEFLCLLNQDTIVKSGWLRETVTLMEEQPQVAAVQSKLLLHPETDKINTLGNRCQYLGFGFMSHYRQKDDAHLNPHRISVASGAAVTVRAELVKQTELFDSRFFLYSEDIDLSWKLRLQGYEVWLQPDSVVYHKYQPAAPYRHYYYLERNRWLLLLKYYRCATLLLISPALLLMEIGQWLFACKHGLLQQRWEMYQYFLQHQQWREIRLRRSQMQRLRKISDRRFTADFTGGVYFDAIDNPLLRYIGNPVLSCYWWLIRCLLF